MRRLQLGVALWFSVLSCATANAADTDEYNNIHTIAVISRVGDTFNFKEVGGTVFSNSDKSIQVPDWGIDDKIASLATEVLSSRFTVLSVRPSASSPVGMSGLSATPDVMMLIHSLPPETKADAYVVIGQWTRQIPTTNQSLSGLGLYRQGKIFGGHNDWLHADYAVSVIDGKTLKQIDYGTARMNDGGYWNSLPAFVPTDEANWADTPDTLSDSQKQAIKTQLFQLLEKSLPHALVSANLVPKSKSN
jgi:hypothetical protein